MLEPEESIEFACSVCGVELEMPADAAGEEVDCPECDSVLRVPFLRRDDSGSSSQGQHRTLLPSEQAAKSSVAIAPAVDVTLDTGVCPICGANRRGWEQTCFACGTPYSIDFSRLKRRPRGIFVGEILQTSTRIFLSRLGVLLPAIAVETIIAVLLYGALLWAIAVGVQWRVDWLAIIVVFVVYCIYHAFHVGHYRFMLAIARGEKVAAHRLIWPTSGVAYVTPALKMIVVSTLYWGAIFFGFLFGVVPAFVFALLAWPCGRLIVDRDIPAGQAISQAIDLTVPHWPGVLSLTAFLFAVQFAVGLAGFGIGQVLAPLIVFCVILPFSSLVLTVTYLRLSDESTAIERRPRPTEANY